MAINDIILHLGPDSRSTARLDTAVALAKAHDARITGVFVKAEPGAPEYWWLAFGKEGAAEWLSTLEKLSAEAEEAFHARIEQEGLESEWRLMDGNPTDAMLTCARYGDLTVTGQTNPDEPSYDSNMPDHLVLGAGGPVLVVPYVGSFNEIGRRVMVAWRGTREAARTVHDAMPILERAESVIIYSVNPEDEGHVAGADICTHLARHGIKSEASHVVLGPEAEAVSPVLKTVGGFGFQQRGAWSQQTQRPAIGEMDVGDALLSAVADHSIDLLVLGAYGHSRIRELALGGATREILGSMTIPVLMSN